MKNINKLIKRHSALSGLVRSITEHQQLLDYVRALLPKSMAPHCLAAIRNGTNLTLFADSPAWSSRLRYLTAELLRTLINNDPRIDRIKIRVIPAISRPGSNRAKRHPNVLPSKEAEHIKSTADFIDDPELAAALRRLAQHVKEH